LLRICSSISFAAAILALVLVSFGMPPSAGEDDGLIAHQIVYEGLARQYFVHAPQSYDPGRPTAVMILFHQDGASGSAIAELSQLNRVADKNGFLAVYPDSVKGAWNDGRRMNRGYQFDDVGFVDRLIRDLQLKWNADPARIYAAGFDGGGFFCQYLALKLPGRLAAVSSVAATLPELIYHKMQLRKPTPVFYILGMDDREVPFKEPEKKKRSKQPRDRLLTASAAVDFWLRGNRCSPRAEQGMLADIDETDGTRVRWLRYAVCSKGSEVLLYGIEGGGHTWPGGYKQSSKLGRTCMDIDGAEEIWKFCARHKLEDSRL